MSSSFDVPANHMGGLAALIAALVLVAMFFGGLAPRGGMHIPANFEECVQGGNPVVETMPHRVCRTWRGQSFAEGASSDGMSSPRATPDCVVAGCSGQTCIEASKQESEGISTCEYRVEYACYKMARCERQPTGQCGWTQTQELSACLAHPPATSQGASPELVF